MVMMNGVEGKTEGTLRRANSHPMASLQRFLAKFFEKGPDVLLLDLAAEFPTMI